MANVKLDDTNSGTFCHSSCMHKHCQILYKCLKNMRTIHRFICIWIFEQICCIRWQLFQRLVFSFPFVVQYKRTRKSKRFFWYENLKCPTEIRKQCAYVHVSWRLCWKPHKINKKHYSFVLELILHLACHRLSVICGHVWQSCHTD